MMLSLAVQYSNFCDWTSSTSL